MLNSSMESTDEHTRVGECRASVCGMLKQVEAGTRTRHDVILIDGEVDGALGQELESRRFLANSS